MSMSTHGDGESSRMRRHQHRHRSMSPPMSPQTSDGEFEAFFDAHPSESAFLATDNLDTQARMTMPVPCP